MTVNNFTKIDDLIKRPDMKKGPIGMPKEAEPVAADKYEFKEVVEHKAEEEVRPYISPRKETIELPPDLKKMGLQVSSSPKFSAYQNIKLPITDEKVIAGMHAPISSSIRWLATLALYLLARVHVGLKVIHGKVTRVDES